jgi:lipopolysaccharide export system permease protein
MLAFKYVSLHYLKYFFIILIALVIFTVGFDYMSTANKLESANLLLIYLTYKSFYATDLLFPLALVFAMISTKILLIRTNALVSFYSLGYSKVDILKPFVVVSTILTMIFVALHAIPHFSRADEFSQNIRKNAQYLSPTRDLFFTYEDKFVYISKMLPLQKKAQNIRVFTIHNNSLKEVLVAKEASYKDDAWFIPKASIIQKPDDVSFSSLGIRVLDGESLSILQGFRPKMLDQVYEGKVNFTIQNALDAYLLLKEQNVNTDAIKSALYRIFIYPFYVPCLIVIIFFFVPISSRFLNVSLFSFGAILASLMVWGILFMLGELAKNKTIPSEVGIIMPVVILFLLSIRQWRKHRLSS